MLTVEPQHWCQIFPVKGYNYFQVLTLWQKEMAESFPFWISAPKAAVARFTERTQQWASLGASASGICSWSDFRDQKIIKLLSFSIWITWYLTHPLRPSICLGNSEQLKVFSLNPLADSWQVSQDEYNRTLRENPLNTNHLREAT